MILLHFEITAVGDDATCLIYERVLGESNKKEEVISTAIQALAEDFLAKINQMSIDEKKAAK